MRTENETSDRAAEFHRLWTALTGETAPGDAVRLHGAGTAPPGPFWLATAAAATVAVTTLAAAELLRLRGIEPGQAAVDTAHAVESFRGGEHLRLDGAPLSTVDSPLSGQYRAADGWVWLDCDRPRQTGALCWGLGVPATVAAVTEAIGKRTAVQAQESVAFAGGAAAAARSRTEWLAHPQGRAVAEAGWNTDTVLDSVPPRVLFDSDRPLGGVRVLELTRDGAGAVAGRVLAAHGADVLRVSTDPGPPGRETLLNGFGKRSARLELTTDGGRARLRKLLARADVLLRSVRPNSLTGRGFLAAELAELRPGLVVADVHDYGWTGPWATRSGGETLLQQACGLTTVAGAEDGEPRPLALPVLGQATGWLTAAAVLTALRAQVHEGGSRHLSLSCAGAADWLDSLGRRENSPSTDSTVDIRDTVDEQWLATVTGPYGELRHLRPPGDLPGAPPYWAEGPHLPGADPPRW